MNPAEINNQEELDRDILYYVRSMQALAEIQLDSVHSFLTVQRRRVQTQPQTRDRLDYLVSAGYLEAKKEWHGGEICTYRITARGMDLLDGKIPPRGWNP